MDPPAIAEDNLWGVHVMWLDGIDMDRLVEDPASKRYIANKRSLDVHPKGWERIGAATVDDRVFMVSVGAYLKIPMPQKNLIVSRVQSWMLKDHAQGVLPIDVVLPLAPKKKPRLRVGQRSHKGPTKKIKRTPASPPRKNKPAPSKNKPATASSSSSSEGPTHRHHRRHMRTQCFTSAYFHSLFASDSRTQIYSLCQNRRPPRRMTTQTMNPFNSKSRTPLSDYTVGYASVFSNVNLGFVLPFKYIICVCIIHVHIMKTNETSEHFNKGIQD
jgi:hypothetical protein